MKAAPDQRASASGHYCRNKNCGWWIEEDQPHSFAIGPLAGHYCFGCEPAGHQCKTFPEIESNTDE